MSYVHVEPMSKITRANLELLIREIQESKPNEEIIALLDMWIKANDLHPESVHIKGGLYHVEA